MRTFIALEPDENAKKIANSFAKYTKRFNNLKLVNEKNIHLTLFFLGDFFNERNISDFINDFRNISFSKIKFKFKYIGFFPNEYRPNVIWISPDEESSSEITKVYTELKDILKSYNFETNDNFKPHITLARVKYHNFKNEDIEFIKKFSFEGFFCFNSLSFFESELTPLGPIYKKILEVK